MHQTHPTNKNDMTALRKMDAEKKTPTRGGTVQRRTPKQRVPLDAYLSPAPINDIDVGVDFLHLTESNKWTILHCFVSIELCVSSNVNNIYIYIFTFGTKICQVYPIYPSCNLKKFPGKYIVCNMCISQLKELDMSSYSGKFWWQNGVDVLEGFFSNPKIPIQAEKPLRSLSSERKSRECKTK